MSTESLIDRGQSREHQERRMDLGVGVGGLSLQSYQGMISRWEGRERRTRGTAGEMEEIKQR